MLAQIPFSVSFQGLWLHMTFGLQKTKHAYPKMTEGELLILREIKQLVFGFTTTTPKKTTNAAGFLLKKKKKAAHKFINNFASKVLLNSCLI